MSENISLSPRQQQIFELMVQGLPTRLIAEQLDLSINTVKAHRAAILRRMEVHSTVALVHKLQSTHNGLSSARMETVALTPAEVLVVEDDENTRALVVSALQVGGFGCRGVADSVGMRAALASADAHIVLLDLNLGEEDGLDLARELRDTHPHVGLIIMTVRGLVEERIEGLARGADAYMVKPVDMRELVVVIRNLHRRQIAQGPLVFQ